MTGPCIVLLAHLAAAAAPATDSEAAAPRHVVCFDFDWRFATGDSADAAEPRFDDREWRKLDLPHDFSVEGPVAKDNPTGTRGGFFPLGTGWYRKQFVLPDGFAQKRVLLRFDGVMYFADVYVNGHHLGREANPYLTRHWDITEYVDPAGPNTVAVRADVPQQMERWYTGAGIYRHAWLVAVEPVRVREFGTYTTTPTVEPDLATVEVRTDLVNQTGTARSCTLETVIVDPRGRHVAEATTAVELPAKADTTAVQELQVPQPRLWSLEAPNLYRAISRVVEGERLRDRYESSFGIRTIRFDAEEGFSLNGRQVLMRGVCLHRDIGGFGAAGPDRAIERRLEILKSMGVNAIRTSHNPYSIEFLELCDRMGFVVIDECFDKWHGFRPDGTGWRESLQRFLARDRNHPSVVLWSVGNEVGQQLRPEGAPILKAMV